MSFIYKTVFMRKLIFFGLTLVAGLLLVSCKNGDDPNAADGTGKMVLNFEHYADGNPLIFDVMEYTNAAENQYEVTEIQYFISDITLNKFDGSKILLDAESFAHYIDSNLPETKNWYLTDAIPDGTYTSITMTFGIKGEKNKPYMFTDPPESDMLWPSNLGGDQGGYHYMKLNGFWLNTAGQREPFNFHLGVGQEHDANNTITGFVQNWFETTMPASFTVKDNETKSITIRMNVEKWWDQPNVFDFNTIGGKIMQNQQAMHMGIENGKSVFAVSQIADVPKD